MAGIRKFFGGVISGGVVAALSLAVVSQLSGPRAVSETAPAAAEPEVTATVVAPAVSDPAETTAAPTTVTPSEPSDAVANAEVAEDVVAGLVGREPEATGEVIPEPVVTTDLVREPEVVAEPEPVMSAPQPAPPQTEVPPQAVLAPTPEGEATTARPVSDAVATLDVEGSGTMTAPAADVAPEGADLPPPPPLTPEEEAILADPAQMPVPGDDAPAREAAMTDDTVVPSPVIEAPEVAEVIPAPQVIVEPAPEVVTAAEPEPEIIATDATPPTLSPDQPLDTDGPSTLPTTPGLIARGEAGVGDRLPQIVPDAPEPAAEEALPEVALNDGPALAQFAAPFENADAKPLFAMLLIDGGEAGTDRQAVAALPFPVTIVLDPLMPDAAAHAALYRAAGKEVVMLASGIPQGATPADLEQTFEAHAAALPEAVAVIDSAAGAFQNDRPLSTQLVPILAAQGRGLLTWDRGLNAADQVARREGLATAMIFRQIDADNEDVPVMRRYLDRAAFKAAQEGEAVVIGTLRAETVAALLEWAIEGRASTVAIAPISAVLAAE